MTKLRLHRGASIIIQFNVPKIAHSFFPIVLMTVYFNIGDLL